MIRRDFLKSALAGVAVSPELMKAIQDKEDAIAVAGNLTQEQVDNGVIHAATFYLRLGDRVEQRWFGQAHSMDAMFLLGSITKPMAITGVTTLVDEGQIDLSDKVVKYLPEFPKATVRRSGFGNCSRIHPVCRTSWRRTRRCVHGTRRSPNSLPGPRVHPAFPSQEYATTTKAWASFWLLKSPSELLGRPFMRCWPAACSVR